MSVIITELSPSRAGVQGANPSLVMRYRIQDTAGELDDASSSSSGQDSSDYTVRALVAATSPKTYDVLVRKEVRTTQLGNGVWEAEVEYGPAETSIARSQQQGVGTISAAFQIGLQQTHITHSYETIASYVAPGYSGSSSGSEMAPDFHNAINVARDSNGITVRGLDIDVPTLEWEETHRVPLSSITSSYISTLYLMAGTTNAYAWRTFSENEVRFLGVSGDILFKLATGEYIPDADLFDDSTAPLTFRFSASPTITNFSIGTITGITKRGWDYLWVLYDSDVDGNELVKKPIAVYVERVFRESDFNTLTLISPWKVASGSSSSGDF
jgi:hypothetical protein